MKIEKTYIKDLFVITPEVFKDERGFFMESYNYKKFKELIKKDIKFVQDNFSQSHKGVLRGIHFQEEPFAQAKLVRVSEGEVFDVAVDLRENSSTYLKWFGIFLSEKNHKMLFIPEGFGHAFLTISDIANVGYKTNNFYNKDSDRCIRWDDPKISIEWPVELLEKGVELSDKDRNGFLM